MESALEMGVTRHRFAEALEDAGFVGGEKNETGHCVEQRGLHDDQRDDGPLHDFKKPGLGKRKAKLIIHRFGHGSGQNSGIDDQRAKFAFIRGVQSIAAVAVEGEQAVEPLLKTEKSRCGEQDTRDGVVGPGPAEMFGHAADQSGQRSPADEAE